MRKFKLWGNTYIERTEIGSWCAEDARFGSGLITYGDTAVEAISFLHLELYEMGIRKQMPLPPSVLHGLFQSKYPELLG